MEPRAPLKVAHPPARAVMLFDGQCGFCRRWAGRLASVTGEAIDYAPGQVAGKAFPEISAEALGQAVHLVEADGTVRRGGAAALRALALAGKERWAWWLYCRVAMFAAIVEMAYAFVARNRGGWLNGLDQWLLGNKPIWPRWRVGRWAFLRGMGVIYLIGFADCWWQVDGLIGSGGIFPMRDFLAFNRGAAGAARWHDLPTLCWLNGSDGFLHAMCLSGCIASVLLILNVLPLGAAMIAWVLYLSLTVAGQIFFALQWDGLLLEAGFLAILYVPLEPWPRLGKEAEPPWITRWLLRWLLFRLMFLSGLVKIVAGGTWTGFTALNYHYMTQPLPPWTAWYMAKLPECFEKFTVFFVFVAELLCPMLVLGPRQLRRIGLWGIAILQVLILATGNYGFFNLLTLVLCLPLLEDDSAFWWWVPGGKWLVGRASGVGNAGGKPAPAPRRGAGGERRAGPPAKRGEGRNDNGLAWPSWVLGPVAVLLVFLTVMAAWRASYAESDRPGTLDAIADYFRPFGIANSYGLFANMTTERPEIIISGSDDGVNWKEYQFQWKPGDVSRRPAFCVPSMPRLDWWMWFAAGGFDRYGGIVDILLGKLRHGSPSVIGLMEYDPFPGRPPTYIRADVFMYRFTTADERRASGAWWHREWRGMVDMRIAPGAPPAK